VRAATFCDGINDALLGAWEDLPHGATITTSASSSTTTTRACRLNAPHEAQRQHADESE
jgi:hypothetical protein